MKRHRSTFVKLRSKPGWAKHLRPYGKRRANKRARKRAREDNAFTSAHVIKTMLLFFAIFACQSVEAQGINLVDEIELDTAEFGAIAEAINALIGECWEHQEETVLFLPDSLTVRHHDINTCDVFTVYCEPMHSGCGTVREVYSITYVIRNDSLVALPKRPGYYIPKRESRIEW